MPHQCTSCGYLFEDGSKEMLSGCPDCGGNTFQFHPKGSPIPEVPDPDESPPDPEGGTIGETVGRATNAVRRRLGGPDDTPAERSSGRPSDSSPDTPQDPSPGHSSDESADSPGTAATPTADTETTTGSEPTASEPTASEPTASESTASESTASESAADAANEPTRSPAEQSPTTDHSSESGVGTPAPESSTPTSSESSDFGHDAEVEQTPPRSTSSEPSVDLSDSPGEESGREDAAQASARTEFVSPDELPQRTAGPDDEPERPQPTDGRVVREPTGRRPSLDELREELNEQFESIKIVEPGQYELNLMGLYNREEYVIALQENGRYVIQMPDDWIRNRE